jgi:hypothetical protein
MGAAPRFWMLPVLLALAGRASEPAIAQMQPGMSPQQQQPGNFDPQEAIREMANRWIRGGMPVGQALQTATQYVSNLLALMKQYPQVGNYPQEAIREMANRLIMTGVPVPEALQTATQYVSNQLALTYQHSLPPQQNYPSSPPQDYEQPPAYLPTPPQQAYQPPPAPAYQPPPAYWPPPPPPPLVPSCAEGYQCMGRTLQADGVWR